MFYLVYCVDRPGSMALREELGEAHWAYMDGFAGELYARGPTLTADGAVATGSLHVVSLETDAAALAFAELEPNWRAGVYESMVVYRFEDLLGRSMWEFGGPAKERFLVIALGDGAELVARDMADVIVLGRLRALGDDGSGGGVGSGGGGGSGGGDVGSGRGVVGVGGCVQASDADAAAAMFRGSDVSVWPWRFGGRPDPGDD
jgi:uncharacterized protein YciI